MPAASDLRPGRNTDLVSLVQAQSRRNAELARDVTARRAEVDALSTEQTDQSDLAPRLAERAAQAGLTAVTGPAVTVTLDDAPESVSANGLDPDLLVVHQQDIQAVVNALWSGGAEAMTIQGQRVISTTGVKCVGNTVVLHGVPYAPPYVISAIGDQRRLRAALADRRRSRSTGSTSRLTGWSIGSGLPIGSRSVPPGPAGSAVRTFRTRSSPRTSRAHVRENDPVPAVKILVIDNYDSFVYNLVQYLSQIGADVEVWRNDDPRFADPDFAAAFDGILLSPGSGHPGGGRGVRRRGAPAGGPSADLRGLPGTAGDRRGLRRRGRPGAGAAARQDLPDHASGVGVLAGLPSPFTATRYHSLAIEPETMPAALEVTATTPSGVIMAVRHRELAVEAVQFHPESVLTEWGYQMLANWLAACGDPDAPARAVGLAPLMSAQTS